MLNRVGTMQVHQTDGLNRVPDMMMIGTWSDALRARSPHAVIKQIEDVAHLTVVARAPSSTPRALAYRFIATLLTMTVNDRHFWDARNEFYRAERHYDLADEYAANERRMLPLVASILADLLP